MRRVAVAAVAALLLAPAVASARVGCPFVADFAGDAKAYGSALRSDTNDASLDILSADLASSSRGLAVVVRLAHLDARDTASPLGTAYVVDFTTPPLRVEPGFGDHLETYSVVVLVPTGVAASAEWGSGTYGAFTRKGAATVRVSGATVTATVPFAGNAEAAPFGRALIGNVRVTAYRLLVPPVPETAGTQPFYGVSVDRADTTHTYRGGTPGCVKV